MSCRLYLQRPIWRTLENILINREFARSTDEATRQADNELWRSFEDRLGKLSFLDTEGSCPFVRAARRMEILDGALTHSQTSITTTAQAYWSADLALGNTVSSLMISLLEWCQTPGHGLLAKYRILLAAALINELEHSQSKQQQIEVAVHGLKPIAHQSASLLIFELIRKGWWDLQSHSRRLMAQGQLKYDWLLPSLPCVLEIPALRCIAQARVTADAPPDSLCQHYVRMKSHLSAMLR